MRKPVSFIFAFILSVLLFSCVKEQEYGTDTLSDGEGWLMLDLAAKASGQVFTKSTQDAVTESMIMDLFLFVFDENGRKLMGMWMQSENRKSSVEEVRMSQSGSWYLENADVPDALTTGCIKVKVASGTGRKVYVISNLNSDFVRISSDMLSNMISNEQDLKDFVVDLNASTIYRNAIFPMVGKLENVTIKTGDLNTPTSPLELDRMDSKVRFIFKTGSRPDGKGQVIKEFRPDKWRVINVPKSAYLITRPYDAGNVDPSVPESSYSDYASNFFDSPWTNFEDYEINGDTGFSFYMLENRQTPKRSAFSGYQERSRQVKEADGTNRSVLVNAADVEGNSTEHRMKVFENANDFSTYVLVKGKVLMDLVNDDAGVVLSADVQYLIHLGNWSASIDNSDGAHWGDDTYSHFADFNTERNTSYTYTVTVNSVDNIRVEVETSNDADLPFKENQPGATGDVVIAKEEIVVCDAHYASRTITFHASSFMSRAKDGTAKMDASNLTWSVNTPFSVGEPLHVDGIDIADHLDYKWVHFRMNKKDDSGIRYLQERRKYITRPFAESPVLRTAWDNVEGDGTPGVSAYHNDGLMDVIGLMRYIKQQVTLYGEYQEELKTNPEAVDRSDFDNGTYIDPERGTLKRDPFGPKICITVFVDENYYDEHPITGVVTPDLWKRFVNRDARSLHILCDANVSTDGESTATGSVVTIQQNSIQCVYNTDNAGLRTAWGVEHVDENQDFWLWRDNSYAGNNSFSNGLLNTAALWGMRDGDSFTSKPLSWNDYMRYEVGNSESQLAEAYRDLRYACLERNRDNNADGVIDRSEIRWYTASLQQLLFLVLCEGQLTPQSRIYNRSAAQIASNDPTQWMQHVISSSTNERGDLMLVWAEEGYSTGPVTQPQEGADERMTIRCLRNLGTNDYYSSLDVEPEPIVEVTTNADGSKFFDMTNANKAALRDYSSRELPLHDEKSRENSPYLYFETSSDADVVSSTDYQRSFPDYNNDVSAAISAGWHNPFCPEGYRLPCQSELAIMRYSGGIFTDNMTRTKWSFGALGNNPKANKYGFCLTSGQIALEPLYISRVRCVRDVRK